MNGTQFAILAYAIGLGLLWGYAAVLWAAARNAAWRASEGQGAAAEAEGGAS